MQLRQELDEIYAAFCGTMPAELRSTACELPHRLRMAPTPAGRWSEVFGQEVTFAAPALFAQAMPQISPVKVRDAVLAHGFAIIDAFGTDRIEDRQIPRTSDLDEVLRRIRQASEAALVRVVGNLADEITSNARAHRMMIQAILSERRIMAEREAVDFEVYERIAVAKAAMGAPASVALARAAGWSVAECQAVAKTLDSIWLGLQCHDDVIDWEDDVRRESAWAVRLAQSFHPGYRRQVNGASDARDMVLGSGILAALLRRSCRHFRAARKRADALGARELATWAGKKEDHAHWLEQEERRNSGYAVRLHALAPWVAQIPS